MTDTRSRIPWVVASAILVSLVLALVLSKPWGHGRTESPADNAPSLALGAHDNKDKVTGSAASYEPTTPSKPSPGSVIEPASPRLPTPASEESKAECRRDEDCDGPRLADCIRPVCQERKCTYDRSTCECLTNDECDDGEPCTRDLCFSSTKACIHIRETCK